MGALAKLLGALCLLGVAAYWYLVPYQLFLALLGAGGALGPVVAYLAAFAVASLVGVWLSMLAISACFVLLLGG